MDPCFGLTYDLIVEARVQNPTLSVRPQRNMLPKAPPTNYKPLDFVRGSKNHHTRTHQQYVSAIGKQIWLMSWEKNSHPMSLGLQHGGRVCGLRRWSKVRYAPIPGWVLVPGCVWRHVKRMCIALVARWRTMRRPCQYAGEWHYPLPRIRMHALGNLSTSTRAPNNAIDLVPS